MNLSAQIGAETRQRLRSPATVAVLVALVVLSFIWIPNPASHATTISWNVGEKGLTSGVYNSAYVGAASAILACCFLTLIGFYLVSGSVRRDAETGVGAILAATPLSKGAYLSGKWAAHVVYLSAVAAFAMGSGVLVFFRYGTGRFEPGAFLLPFFLFVVPGLAFVAAVAVAFDVTPGLKGRGGLVLWFFAWIFLLIAIPSEVFKKRPPGRDALYDPAGIAMMTDKIQASIPGAARNSISIGYEVQDKPLRRVVWSGFDYSLRLILHRAGALLWVIPPLAFAVLVFDRFDPARRRARWKKIRRSETVRPEGANEPPASPQAFHLSQHSPAALHPGFAAAIAAETGLLWQNASWLKWPLLAAALACGVAPGEAFRGAAAAFLLLIAPVISEAAAREEISGTGALVFSQPSIPRSRILWKTSSVALFVIALGVPGILRAAASSPAKGAEYLSGLLFVAGFAAGAGALTGGGKLFTGLYTAIWYAGVSGGGAFDYCGVFSKAAVPVATSLAYLAFAAVLTGAAMLRETVRASRFAI